MLRLFQPILGIFIVFCYQKVDGHGIFLCPKPLGEVDNITTAPCGNGQSGDTQFIEVQPGPFSIKWIDNNKLIGSLYRVSLRSWDVETDYCILQDRIPSSECIGNFTEDGNCTMEYYLTVEIPNVLCDNCYLQMTTINTNGSDCLVDLDSRSSECGPLYYSCANIRVSGSNSLQVCESQFLERQSDWPVQVTNNTREYTVDFRENPNLFRFALGSLSYKPVGSTRGRLTYRVELWVPISIILDKVFWAWRSNKRMVTFQPLRGTDTYGVYEGTLQLFSTPNKRLLNDELLIFISYKSNETIAEDFEEVVLLLKRSAEVYTEATGNYTEDGWLTGPQFDGPTAKFIDVVDPAGICPPQPPTTSTEATTTDIELKNIPKDPNPKDSSGRERIRFMFTRASGIKTQPSWITTIVTILILTCRAV